MKKLSVSPKSRSLLLSAVALLAVAAAGGFFLGIPAVQGLLMSFKDYLRYLDADSLWTNLRESPWVGLANYRTLFATQDVGLLAGNSLLFGLLSGIPAVLAGGALGFALGKVSLAGRRSAALLGCCLLPLFLPEQLYAFALQSGSELEMAVGPEAARLLTIAFSGIRRFCFTAFLSGACALAGRSRGIAPGRASLMGTGAVFAMLLSRAFTPPALNLLLQESYQQQEYHELFATLDLYHFRMLFAPFTFLDGVGPGVAGVELKWLLQLPGLLLGVILLLLLFKKQAAAPRQAAGKGSSVPALAVGALCCAAALAGLGYVMTLDPGFLEPKERLFESFGASLLALAVSGALFGALLALFLLVCYRLPAAGGCLALVLFSLPQNLAELIFFYPCLFGENDLLAAGVWSCWDGLALLVPLAVVGGLLRGEDGGLAGWLKRMLPFALLFFGLFLATSWGGVLDKWMTNLDNYPLPLLLRKWQNQNQWIALSPNASMLWSSWEPLTGGITDFLLLYGGAPLLIGAACIALFALLFPKGEADS